MSAIGDLDTKAEALALARSYAKETTGLVALENKLAACQCEAVRARSGLRDVWRRLRGGRA